MESCGPFTLVGQVGAGTLTEVWRAVKISDGRAGPQYAVKRTLAPLQEEREFESALVQSGQAAMGLSHPNVVRTVDAGMQPAKQMGDFERAYVAQEFVVGRPLNAVLNQMRSSTREIPRALTFTVVASVLQGLHHAHQAVRGGVAAAVVHGDVAPVNVLVGADGVVRLSDFCIGRARAYIRRPHNQHLKLRHHYVAPETARTGQLDPRSDIYSVGVILHEMLAFRRLRRGNTPEEILQQAQSGAWAPLAALGVATDAELDNLLARALHDDPNQRFQTAEEFLRLLAGYATARQLVMTAFDLSGLMSTHFPQLPADEQAGKAQVDAVFGTLEGRTVIPEPEAIAPAVGPSRHRSATYRPRASHDGALKLAGAAAAGIALLAGGGYFLMKRGPSETEITTPTEAPRDLSRLVGGRTVLFWSERVETLDRAIADATKRTGDENHPDVQQLKALRADTVRKGQALGFKELGTVAPPAAE